jgi:hypothetical protein
MPTRQRRRERRVRSCSRSSGLTALAVVLRALRVTPVVPRLVGIVATGAGLARCGRSRCCGRSRWRRWVVQGMVELLLGTALLGSILFGMLLGHWYLVERRLTNRPMVTVVSWINVAVLGAGLASVLLSWRNPAPCAGLDGAAFQQCSLLFAPVLRIGSMTIVLGLGVLSLLALIAAFNVRLAREGGRSIQAATGMFYLAVILAPAVEFAAKVRFFPPV